VLGVLRRDPDLNTATISSHQLRKSLERGLVANVARSIEAKGCNDVHCDYYFNLSSQFARQVFSYMHPVIEPKVGI
jgi:hypothetical protein